VEPGKEMGKERNLVGEKTYRRGGAPKALGGERIWPTLEGLPSPRRVNRIMGEPASLEEATKKKGERQNIEPRGCMLRRGG